MAVAMIERDAPAGSFAPALKERMEAFVGEVTGVAMRHTVQRANAEVYVRGLLAAGARKSLEPLVERLDGDDTGAQHVRACALTGASGARRACINAPPARRRGS